MNNTQETKQKKSVGRPTVMTDEVIRKIEEVAALDGTVEEMAYYAGIHRDTIYARLKENKTFSDRIADLKQRPILKARQTITKSLDDPKNAQWYLERKKKVEFAAKTEVDLNNPDGNLKTIIINKYGSNDQLTTETD